ncbi:MAG: HAD family hydrolase [Pseudomonadota bacterium]
MPCPVQKPKAIIFDWDGTLADTRGIVVNALEQTLAAYGLPAWDIVKAQKRDPNKSLKENFAHFFGADEEEAYQKYLLFYEAELVHLKPQPGADTLLSFLSGLQILLCIASNKEKSVLLKEINTLFPHTRFQNILGNGDAAANKPNPAPILQIMEQLNITKPDDTWLVGDSRQDTDCAHTAGCRPVLIGKGKFTDDRYIKEMQNATPALAWFGRLSDFQHWLENNTP